MSKLAYTIFLAIATAKDVGIILGLDENIIISFIYLVLFFTVVIKLITNTLQPWVWTHGLTIVGISGLIFLLLTLCGLKDPILQKLNAVVCLYAWIKSMNYLINYRDGFSDI